MKDIDKADKTIQVSVILYASTPIQHRPNKTRDYLHFHQYYVCDIISGYVTHSGKMYYFTRVTLVPPSIMTKASRAGRHFTVVIHSNDVKKIFSWALKHPTEETGGDLFGLWQKAHESTEHTLNVRHVIGPGRLCRRTSFSFHQDVRYASQIEDYLDQNHGMQHVAIWHSHQNGLDRPSAEDEKMVWGTMPSHDINRFVLIIVNITDRNRESVVVSLKCFLFEIDAKTEECLPVLLGKFRVLLAGENTRTDGIDLHNVEMQAGAACLVSQGDLASLDITETETRITGFRKK